jgi:soluble lytic murein transglycosylase-like protein
MPLPRLFLSAGIALAAASGVHAQGFPSPQEYPVTFATTSSASGAAAARGKAKSTPLREARARRTTGARPAPGPSPELAVLIARHASANGVPAELAHRVIMRESRYNTSARNRSYWGLMQISYATARGVGYRGPAQGLLNPDTNLRYGMAYLGNAYRVAGGDQQRAVKLYTGGYYYEAKRKGMLGQLRRPADAPLLATR